MGRGRVCSLSVLARVFCHSSRTSRACLRPIKSVPKAASSANTHALHLQAPVWDFKSLTIERAMNWTAQDSPEAMNVRRTRGTELGFIDKSELTLVVGPQEVSLIQQYRRDAKVAVVSNIFDVSDLPETDCHGRTGMLFVGNMNHIPNR
jgi:hypothetical protein